MCGIAGIIHFTGQTAALSDLRTMTDAIRHRGPDGEGFFVHENIGFGHRRLAVIDLSDHAAQPMTAFGCTITYNGEIYNYPELKSALIKLGYTFQSGSDTEVVLAAYRHWGTDCVAHFNGMWAFAIYDPEKQFVFFSRDRFGEKPFYYSFMNRSFTFCSELKGLISVFSQKTEPNEEMLARFLVFEKAEHKEETFFKHIKKLPAGCNMILNLRKENISINEYYSPKYTDSLEKLSDTSLKKYFLEKLSNAVAIRMRSDIQVGTCLSGGLDSSSIAYLASAEANNLKWHDFSAITAGHPDSVKDERKYAQMVANSCGLKWHQILPLKDDYLKVIDNVIHAQEEPFHSTSVLMQYFVMQKAAQEGIKVLLDGQGADELLLGYQTHLAWWLKSRGGFGFIRNGLNVMQHNQIPITTLLMLLFYHTNPARKRKRQLARFPGLSHHLKKNLLQDTEQENQMPKDLFTRQVNELFQSSLPMLLRYEDKNAMAFSVETRLPFLDVELVEFLLNLPYSSKIRNGWSKFILRQILSGSLPFQISWREGKIGYEGLSANLLLKDLHLNNRHAVSWVEGKTGAKLSTVNGEQFWRLFIVTKWCQKWFLD